MLLCKRDYEAALEFNLEALDYDDTDPVILDNLGQTYYLMGDLDNAFKYFNKAKEQKEDQVDTLFYLGNIYLQRGQREEAKEHYKKALECNISALNTISRQDIEAKLKEIE